MVKNLIVTDVKGWAYWNNAHQIAKNLSDMEFEIIDQKEYSSNRIKYDVWNKYDNKYFMNWLKDGIDHSQFSTLISSHRLELNLKDQANNLLPKYKNLVCNSLKLFTYVKNNFPNSNVFYCPNGVDTELFCPEGGYRKQNVGGKFRVGYVSKSMAGKDFYSDLKGHDSVLMPLIDRMKKYPEIEFVTHCNNWKTAIPQSEMPKVYEGFDCLIVTSYREGTPNSLMEACAMELPVISTDVGVASKILIPEFVLPPLDSPKDVGMTIHRLEKRILDLATNPNKALMVGRENRLRVLGWDWKNLAENYRQIFS